MQKTLKKFPAFCALILLCSHVYADVSADVQKGEKLFKMQCAGCHGRSGEKSAMGQSAIIKNMPANDVVTALQKRKSGEIQGAGNAVKERLSEQDMKDIATFLEKK